MEKEVIGAAAFETVAASDVAGVESSAGDAGATEVGVGGGDFLGLLFFGFALYLLSSMTSNSR